jgi:hypothetical protein
MRGQALAIVLGGMAIWGMVGSGSVAPQQHRLVESAGPAAGIALSLNASALYLGIGPGRPARRLRRRHRRRRPALADRRQLQRARVTAASRLRGGRTPCNAGTRSCDLSGELNAWKPSRSSLSTR